MADMYFENLPSTNTPLIASNLDKLNDIKVSATEPNTGEKVWLQKGKNLFDGILELGGFNSNGTKLSNTDNYRSANFTKVKSNTEYTFSINGTKQGYVVLFYDNNATFLSSSNVNSGTFVTPAGAELIMFRCFAADFTSNYASLNVQLEQGSEATSYEAYVESEMYVKNNNNVYENLMLGKEIVESGSNSNGSYIKYSDGTMICYKVTIVQASIKQAWGSIYINGYNPVNAGNYAQPFVGALPIVMQNSIGGVSWVINAAVGSLTAPPSIYLAAAKTEEDQDITLRVIAIGRWK